MSRREFASPAKQIIQTSGSNTRVHNEQHGTTVSRGCSTSVACRVYWNCYVLDKRQFVLHIGVSLFNIPSLSWLCLRQLVSLPPQPSEIQPTTDTKTAITDQFFIYLSMQSKKRSLNRLCSPFFSVSDRSSSNAPPPTPHPPREITGRQVNSLPKDAGTGSAPRVKKSKTCS